MDKLLLDINQDIKQQKVEVIKYGKIINNEGLIYGKYKYYNNNELLKITNYLSKNNYNRTNYKLSKYKYKRIYKQIIDNDANRLVEYKIDTMHNFIIDNNMILINYSSNNVILTKFPNIIKYTEINNYNIIEYNNSFITVQLITNQKSKKQKTFIKVIINVDLKQNNIDFILSTIKTSGILNIL